MSSNKETRWVVGSLPYFPILTIILIVGALVIVRALTAPGRDITELVRSE